MTRKVSIHHSLDQASQTFMTDAITFGDLLEEFDGKNINYENMVIREGVTQTEYNPREDFNKVLPSEVTKRDGSVTTELVFFITRDKKHVPSGAMSRTDAYQYITENNLKDRIKEKFGKNFTNCPTEILVTFCAKHMNQNIKKNVVMNNKDIPASKTTNVTANKPVEHAEKVSKVEFEAFARQVESTFKKVVEMINILNDEDDYLDNQELFDLMRSLNNFRTPSNNALTSDFSPEEIAEMRNNLRLN